MSIEIAHITKDYGKKRALNDVSLQLEHGVIGLLGANGAGKSTLIHILVTALAPTRGQVLYNGRDIRDRRSGYLEKLGYMPQSPKFYKNYTAEEFLRYIAALKGMKHTGKQKIDELLAFVNLTESRKTKIGAFSGGMLQRLGIAQALLNDPEILILDEPTAGLDPRERIRFRNLVSDVSQNRTVLLATHIVQDIEYIANRIILLHEGKVCRSDTPDALCKEIGGKVWVVIAAGRDLEPLLSQHKISNIHREGNIYRVRMVCEEKPHPNALAVTPTLEEVFLYHAGEVSL